MQHAPIAVISQSGALAGAIGNALQDSGIGCSYIVSVGNETCLDALDALSCVIEQDDVRVVALYIEGLDDASRILQIAQRARERGVQIVALKAGRSAVGQQATASHTGKIASSHAVYADVLEQAGVISVDSLPRPWRPSKSLAFLRNPRVSGDPKGGISVLSASGGAGALLADHSSEFGHTDGGVQLRDDRERSKKILPEFARKANPDRPDGADQHRSRRCSRTPASAVAADPRTEAIVVQFASSGRRYLQENARSVQGPGARAAGGPELHRRDRWSRTHARSCARRACCCRPIPRHDEGLVAAVPARNAHVRCRSCRSATPLPPRGAPRDWAEMMQFCEDSGVTPAKWVVLGPQDRAAQACADLSYPLVVKVLPSESEHKTELGLVKLRVQIARGCRRASRPSSASGWASRRPGILVQEMVGDGVEVVLSCLRKTDFGPVISIGTGGVAIELYRDVTYLALPVSRRAGR